MVGEQKTWKLAEQLQAGDVIESRQSGRLRALLVSDVRFVKDSFVHVDTGDGTATSIYMHGDVVFLGGHIEARCRGLMSSHNLDIQPGGVQNQP